LSSPAAEPSGATICYRNIIHKLLEVDIILRILSLKESLLHWMKLKQMRLS